MKLSPLTSPLLKVPHGFFSRAGGVSEGIYAGLNCGAGSRDSAEHVLENRKRVQDYFAAEALCTLYQIHSNTVVTLTEDWQQFNAPNADAMVTRMPGLALGILTADCAPVLFADKKAGVIGAAHAGWKGALEGVLENTIAAMEKLGATREHIHAAIGPCIAQESYQVDTIFHGNFLAADAAHSRFFDHDISSPSHYLFDLKGFCESRLQASGLTQIHTLPDNSYTEESLFFSYRRTTHRNEADYGRQISAIALD